MRARLVAAALVGALAAGCGSQVADAGLVDGLRLLGVQAEPPEAAPGQTVTLTAWAVDPHGGAVTIDWQACPLTDGGRTATACLTGTPALLPLGSGASITVAVPDVSRDALGPEDATGGIYLPIVVHVRAPDDAVDGVYRLRLAGALPPNHNPVFAAVQPLTPGVPQPVHAGDKLDLHALYTNDSLEMYQVPSTDGLVHFVQETLTTQWFATAGTFGDLASGLVTIEVLTLDRELPPPGGSVDLWAVGHDERGGTTMGHFTLQIQ